MYIRNLTPHSVTVAGITIEPSGIVARVSAATADAGSVDFNGTTIPLTTTVYGEVQNLSRPARRHSAHREQPRRRTVQGPYRCLHPQ